MIKLYAHLSEMGVTRDQVIARDENYLATFDNHDQMVDVYKRNPTERSEELVDRSATTIYKKIQSEMPDLFNEEDHPVSADYKDEFSQETETSFIEEKAYIKKMVSGGDANYDKVLEWLDEQPPAKQGRVLEQNNYQVVTEALRAKGDKTIGLIMERAKSSGIYNAIVRAIGGDMFVKIVNTHNHGFIADATTSLAKNKREAKELTKNGVAMQLAIESGDSAIIKTMEEFYDAIGAEKFVESGEDLHAQLKGVKEIIKVIEKGELNLDHGTNIIIGRKQALQFRAFGDIKSDKIYHIVHHEEDANYFSGNPSIYKHNGLEIREVKDIIPIERRLGVSKYEIMAAWTNFCGLPSLEHNIALMGIAKLAETMNLIMDPGNDALMNSYLTKLNYVTSHPKSLSIGNYYVSIQEAWLGELVTAGFLDSALIPTEQFYLLLYIHQYKFPFGTHPFECVDVNIEGQFMYDVFAGKHGTNKFMSDGEIMYENIEYIPNKKPKEALVEISREVVSNLDNPSISKIKIAEAVNEGFVPLFYTIAVNDSDRPALTVASLGYARRVVNFGAYNFVSEINNTNIWINSFAVRSFMQKVDCEVLTYSGSLSRMLLSSSDGVILKDKDKNKNQKLVIRAMNYTSLTAENWKTEEARKEMEGEFFNPIIKGTEPDLLELLRSGLGIKSKSLFPPVIQRVTATIEPPVPATAERKPILKTNLTRVARRDDRVYLSEQNAKRTFPSNLLAVYNKVRTLASEQRDEAILKELLAARIDSISPTNLVNLGFNLKQWAVKDTHIVMKTAQANYELKMPSYLTGVYYIKRT